MSRDWKSLSTRLAGTVACLAVGAAWVQYCITQGRYFIQPDRIFSIYCGVIGRGSPEASCPNAELMILFPLLIVIALIYYMIVALLAVSPIGAAIAGIFLIWRRKGRREAIAQTGQNGTSKPRAKISLKELFKRVRDGESEDNA